MKEKWKRKLKEEYPQPDLERKQVFLNQLEEPELSLIEFVWMQMGYLRKWSWILGIGMLLLTFVAEHHLKEWNLCFLSSAVPFVAVGVVTEFCRSQRYGMEELELSSRFSLKMVVLSRLGILGTGDLLLLAAGVPLLWGIGYHSVVNTAVYILIPYLLTVFSSLWAVRHWRGKEGGYFSIGIAGCISLFYLAFGNTKAWISLFLEKERWVVLLILLLFLSGKEFRKILKDTEEYIWNSSLID